MKTLAALGVLAGGGYFSPTPKAIVTTVLWVASPPYKAFVKGRSVRINCCLL